MKSYLIICLCFLFTPFCIQAQDYYFKHYQVENGLSNNTTVCLLEDNKGFIWIGTKDGLNRFDGYSFKTFRNIPNDPGSLGNNSIHKLFEDKDGIIWVGTERGLYTYNPLTEKFAHIAYSPKMEVRGIQEDNNGDIWFTIQFKLYKYVKKTKKLTYYQMDSGQGLCTTIYKSNDGTIWIGTISGYIASYNQKTGRFNAYSVFNHSTASVSTWIETMYDSGEGYLFIGTSNQGVKKFYPADHIYTDFLTHTETNADIYARDFIRVREHEFWIATESGVFIYNSQTNQLTNLKKNTTNPYAISDNAVYALCKDREGGIWMATFFGGINYYPRERLVFKKYFPQVGQNSIHGNAIREIVKDKNGNMWIGTEDSGLNKYDPTLQAFTHFIATPDRHSIAYNNIHGLLLDKDNLWIGTFEHGLNIMDIHTGKVFKRYIAGPSANDLKSNFIHSLYKNKQGQIFIGTSNGLYLYNDTADNFMHFNFMPPDGFFSAITEDANGTMWAGTFQHGLYYFNEKKQIHGKLYLKQNGKDKLSESRITYLFEDSKKRLWIATENGLYNVDFNNNKATHTFSTTNGFPSNLIYAIIEDNIGKFWITTSKGLVALDSSLQKVSIYNKSRGLLSDQFNYSSAFKDTAGIIYFGCVKGMISFDPSQLLEDKYTPPIYITNLQIFNKDIPISESKGLLRQSMLFTNKIVLNHLQSSISFDFAALNFISPDNIEYAYQLDGLDKSWNLAPSNRKIYFTNLQPGTYLLKIKSTNSNGLWRNNEKKLIIIVTPPFWKTSWAYALYAFLVTASVFLVIFLIHKRQIEKQKREMQLFEIKKEKEVFSSKIDFFTKVAHEIRTPLTLIQAPMEKLLNQNNKTPETEKYLHVMNKNTMRLLDLTNQLLSFRKIESQQFALRLEQTNITALLEDIYSDFQPIAEQKNIQFRLQVPGEPIWAHIDNDAFTKIISNLLDNAIKYGKTFVMLEAMAAIDSNTFSTQVTNDGEPIPNALQEKIFELFFRPKKTSSITGTGIGLALARSLASLHNGTLTVIDDEKMIIFKLVLPLHPNKEI